MTDSLPPFTNGRCGLGPAAATSLTLAVDVANAALAPLRAQCAELVAVALSTLHPALLQICSPANSLDAELARWAADW